MATLRAWALTARPGERRVYYLGFLAMAADVVRPLAAAAYELYEVGHVSLIQQRIEPDVFAYIAERRSSGRLWGCKGECQGCG